MQTYGAHCSSISNRPKCKCKTKMEMHRIQIRMKHSLKHDTCVLAMANILQKWI